MKKKKKKNKFINELIKQIREEKFFLLFCVLLTFILLYPVDYFITTGGGVINIEDRVKIEDSYKSKGSLNISYVSQTKGTTLTYLLSYIIPTWEREKVSDYLIDEYDNQKNLDYRDKMELNQSNSNATYWGYTLAGEDIELESSDMYVVYVFKEYKNDFKVKDQIISINGKKFSNFTELKSYINSFNVGDTVKVEVLRNKKIKAFESKIYDNKGDKILGITLTLINNYKTSKDIEFSFKSNESGPSAGFITTLNIYNKLTKEDITNGQVIAGTGTIESDGSIGEIGGVNYKVLGAAKAKADLFMVPKDNYKECMKTVKENNLKIKVISVDTIEDAINKLKELK